MYRYLKNEDTIRSTMAMWYKNSYDSLNFKMSEQSKIFKKILLVG